MGSSSNRTATKPPSEPGADRRQIGVSARRMSWSLIDQAVMSISNFALMLTLARLLEPADYGRLAIAYSLFYLFVGWNGSIVIYPLTLRIAERPEDGVHTTAGAIGVAALLAPMWATVTFSTLVWLLGLEAAAAAAFAVLAWIPFDTARRSLQSRLMHRHMLIGDLVTFPGQIAAVLLLTRQDQASLTDIFIALGGLFLAGAATHCAMLGVRAKWLSWPSTRAHLDQCRRLGTWRVMGDMTNVVTIVAYSWNVALFSGLQAAAGLRAISNLTGLTHPLTRGIEGVLTPEIAHEMRRKSGRPRRLSAQLGAMGGALVGLVLFCIVIAPSFLLGLLYGSDSPYVELDTELRLLCLVYAIAYLGRVLNSYLGAMGRPREAVRARLETVGFAVAIGHPMASLGLLWALVAMASTRVVAAIATLRRIVIMEHK